MANYGKYYIADRLLPEKQYLKANVWRNRIVKRSELEDFLAEHDMPVSLKTVHESLFFWEAHPHFLHQNTP